MNSSTPCLLSCYTVWSKTTHHQTLHSLLIFIFQIFQIKIIIILNFYGVSYPAPCSRSEVSRKERGDEMEQY